MQGPVKASTVGIILGVIVLFFIINQWMSQEIGKSPSSQAAIPAPAAQNDAALPTMNAPAPLEEEMVVEQPMTNTQPAKSKEENVETYEPIYEPPGNSVILVQ